MAVRSIKNHDKYKRQTAYREKKSNRQAYVYGNAVPKNHPTVGVSRDEDPVMAKIQKRKNRERIRRIQVGYITFVFGALIVTGMILVGYIELQSSITVSAKNIASLESQVNSLKEANTQEYNRIVSGIDLEEIKQIALQELGMQYATEGQVLEIEGGTSDYVEQYSAIPTK
ncbi:MAG: cell division protein FtsL [Eubacteriales bacterium]